MLLRRVKDESGMSDFMLEEEFKRAAKQTFKQEHNIPLDKELEVSMSKETSIGILSRKSLKETLFSELSI
tara:strand:- start:288 stop:497 length:210 start_codon:yes stop_codon:yes gene_type:complete